jgi:hypothetical protein
MHIGFFHGCQNIIWRNKFERGWKKKGPACTTAPEVRECGAPCRIREMGRSANNLDKIVVLGAAPPLRFPTSRAFTT